MRSKEIRDTPPSSTPPENPEAPARGVQVFSVVQLQVFTAREPHSCVCRHPAGAGAARRPDKSVADRVADR